MILGFVFLTLAAGGAPVIDTLELAACHGHSAVFATALEFDNSLGSSPPLVLFRVTRTLKGLAVGSCFRVSAGDFVPGKDYFLVLLRPEPPTPIDPSDLDCTRAASPPIFESFPRKPIVYQDNLVWFKDLSSHSSPSKCVCGCDTPCANPEFSGYAAADPEWLVHVVGAVTSTPPCR